MSLIPAAKQLLQASGTLFPAAFQAGIAAAAVAREVQQRYQADLKKPVDRRLVSIELRRLVKRGLLYVARRGRPHAEALYVRQRPAGR